MVSPELISSTADIKKSSRQRSLGVGVRIWEESWEFEEMQKKKKVMKELRLIHKHGGGYPDITLPAISLFLLISLLSNVIESLRKFTGWRKWSG